MQGYTKLSAPVLAAWASRAVPGLGMALEEARILVRCAASDGEAYYTSTDGRLYVAEEDRAGNMQEADIFEESQAAYGAVSTEYDAIEEKLDEEDLPQAEYMRLTRHARRIKSELDTLGGLIAKAEDAMANR